MSGSLLTRHGRLVLVPAVITLAVTLLRLVGELQQWSPTLFNREAGGGGALIGIVWLVPVFGIYFALKLAGQGEGPGRIGRALGFTLLALILLPASATLAQGMGMDPYGRLTFLLYVVAAVLAAVIAMKAWPELWRVLLAYALAARIPVALVMLVAILGDWGTHYDVPPTPDFPAMAPLAKWFWIGLVPQLTVWIAFTVVVGMLFGLIAAALFRRGRPVQPA
jgi:hypothetical protein